MHRFGPRAIVPRVREEWTELVGRVSQCRTCHATSEAPGLAEPGSRPIFMRGDPSKSDVLVIMEAPNRSDTFDPDKGYLTYDADTDPTGRFLRDLFFEELGETEEMLAVTNSVLCLPRARGGGYPVTAPIRRACASHLDAQIKAIDPLIVASLGGAALTSLIEIEDHGYRRLGDAIAKETRWNGRVLFPLAHPGRLGRLNRNEDQQRNDWRALRGVLRRLR